MKVKQSVLDKVNNVDSRRRISEKLDIGDQMLYKHMKANASDGELTKITALYAIAEEAQMPVLEIIDDESENEVNAESVTDAVAETK